MLPPCTVKADACGEVGEGTIVFFLYPNMNNGVLGTQIHIAPNKIF